MSDPRKLLDHSRVSFLFPFFVHPFFGVVGRFSRGVGESSWLGRGEGPSACDFIVLGSGGRVWCWTRGAWRASSKWLQSDRDKDQRYVRFCGIPMLT